MADRDIPVAVATEVTGAPYVNEPPRRTMLEKGRSSRVCVTTEQGNALGEYEVHTLKSQGYTSGLVDAMRSNSQTFPLRIWVVDNSGSMAMNDGCRMAQTKDKTVKLVQCSRWTEIQETVDYHAQMAALLQAPTVFRLLNDPGKMIGPQQFSIAERGAELIQQDLQVAQATMKNASPSGVTPLADHIREIRSNVLELHQQLMSNGQKIAIILATDGLPTDSMGQCSQSTRHEFETSLRSLEGLPVWIVIRLCTDEENIVEYYNGLDAQLELSLEVLDDFVSEAKEVYDENPWLNYSLCLHRIREMGFNHRLFDLLDERKFTIDELHEFFILVLGAGNLDGVPDPHVDWNGFMEQVSIAVSKESKQWNPVTKRMAPWIDVHKVNKIYGEGMCVIS